jgi:hypothetical protein
VSAANPDEVSGYTRLERVGQGGFSVVYRAYQEHLQRTVALKVLLLDATDERELRRFRRECQLTGRLTGHPNIVTVLDTGVTGSGRAYVAMEYFERGSLRDRLAREGPLPVEDVLRVGAKIGSALAAAHQAGILHRDVKPQNILVSRYGEPALADFGIATLVETAEVSAHSDALTPYHAAPEILEGRPPSVASDVYSLGSTLYQLLAGRPAHQKDEGGGVSSLLLRILTAEPPDIARPEVPPEVVGFVHQAMARSPQDRFPSALALAQRARGLQQELGLPVTELVASGPRFGAQTAGEPEPAVTAAAPPSGPPAVPSAVPPAAAAPAPAPAPPRLESTVVITGRAVVPPVIPRPPPPWWRRPRVAALAALGAAVLAGSAWLGSHLTSGPPRQGAPATSPAATATAPVVSQSALDAARPTGLAVVDRGTSAVLRWQLGPGNRYPLFVQEAVSGRPPGAPRPVPLGATTTTVDGLDPAAGYCFEVGALVALGQPSTVAWSEPVCIRGAVARPTATP